MPGSWQIFGRGQIVPHAASVTIANEWAAELTPRDACQISFRGRMPQDTAQVQIWGAIRVKDRNSRYVFALRGGVEPEISLARYAPDNHARFLGFAPLNFVPQPGEWYTIRAEVSKNRFQIYLNDEKLPRLNVEDGDAEWTQGGIGIGGGWLPTEFSNLKVSTLEGADLAAFNQVGDAQWAPPSPDKKALRAAQRAAYQPAKIETLPPTRGEFSLDGDWLFMPDQDLGDNAQPPTQSGISDQQWHVLTVPSFWSPTLGWLHGEGDLPGLTGLSASRGPSDKLVADEQARVDGLTFDWKKTEAGWYRHHLILPPSLEEREFVLSFDAIAKVSEIYVNGIQVATNVGMFRRIECDITKALQPGENVIAVHVAENPAHTTHGSDKTVATAVTVEVTDDMIRALPHGMTTGNPVGIWQPVKLIVTNPTRVGSVFVEPRLDGASAEIDLLNGDSKDHTVDLSYEIRDWKDHSILLGTTKGPTVLVPAEGKISTQLETPTLQPKLWSPQSPNLYVLQLDLTENGVQLDRQETRFGFRTFTVSGTKLLLNGKPYWLRGGNHTPATLRPNDGELARKFITLAREGNVMMTRSHAIPFTQTWLDAADELGMGVSYEGTWPWLLIKGEPPAPETLKAWKDEFASLLEENRNHPSLLLWTVNNEMNFGLFDEKDLPLMKKKWTILDDIIRTMRTIDPTRPIVAYSNYSRAETKKGYDAVVVPNHFDDGDIDDIHRYYGWYNPSFFHLFHGEFGQLATPDRPLISQELSTGYPRNDDWPSRSYEFPRYVPQALVGDYAMEGSDPSIFMTRQAFMTKELTEVIRRTNRETVAGIFPFAYLTWFTNVWESDKITPKLTYYELKKAMAPVLVSAELTGRHFYADEKAERRVCIVNDDSELKEIPAGMLTWEIHAGDMTLAQGTEKTAATPYYMNQWLNVTFAMPTELPSPRTDAKLTLTLTAEGITYSTNDYDIVLTSKNWTTVTASPGDKIQLLDPSNKAAASTADLNVIRVDSIDQASPAAPLLVGDPSSIDGAALQAFAEKGGRVLLLQPGEALVKAFPAQVKSYRPTEGEIAMMQVPESPVFAGIEPLDTAWFEMGPDAIPQACTGTWQVDREQPGITTLATQCDLHSEMKNTTFFAIAGSPLIELHFGKGLILASEMNLGAKDRDPIAARLLANMIVYLGNPEEGK